MATVFSVFKSVPYTYLEISRGTVYGNRITSQRELMGVFKERDAMKLAGNVENYQSDARLHVKPRDFKVNSCKELVGNGILVNGQFYSIRNASAGTDFDTGIIAHYRLDLELSDFVKEVYGG